jgi:hypothetical protein
MSDQNKIGRPNKYKSKKDAAEAAKDYQKSYLEVRRKRYSEDPQYRDMLIKRDRDRYRALNPNFQPKGFGANAGMASSFSKTVPKYLTVEEMSVFLGVAKKVVSVWIAAGKFPAPKLLSKDGVRIYTFAQANQFAYILAEGLDGRAAFRGTDVEVIEKLKTAMEKSK